MDPTTTPAERVAMTTGKTYRLRLHYQAGNGHWVERTMCARYIGEDVMHAQKRYVFSGRPVFGTTEIDPKDVMSATQVPDGTAPHGPRPLKPSER